MAHRNTGTPTTTRLTTEFLTPARRRRAYVILTALVPVAVLYGWLDQTAAAVWLGVTGAVLGTGMAAAHTPTGGDAE